MKTLALAFAVIASAAICGHAQQSPVTAFDGKYLGVSINVSGSGFTCRVATGRTGRPLFIQGGIAVTNGGTYGDLHFQGTVTADGRAMLRDQQAHIINVKIDPSGKALGVASNGGPCTYTTVWQKQ